MVYSLANSYVGDSLLSGFNWVDTPDFSNGFVRYKSQSDATTMGLFAVDQQTGVVRLGVDSTNQFSLSEGRPSIRIESKEAYNHGLFIADFQHMPPSQCGVWPAFWAYGPSWPKSGEIDIIEGANTVHRNLISAHTGPGCKVDQETASMATGFTQTNDCDVGVQNIGCGFVPAEQDASTYGDTFNAVNGGVYAMNWDSDYIKVWHFDRNSIPSDIEAKEPEPDTWGKPTAIFGGSSCDVDNYFKDMSIVLNINFCGDYGNAVWDNDGCNALAPTCNEWVANNPAAFANAYWDINYIDAYVQGPGDNSSDGSGGFIPAPFESSIPEPGEVPMPGEIPMPGETPMPGTRPVATSTPGDMSTPGNNKSVKANNNNTIDAYNSIESGNGARLGNSTSEIGGNSKSGNSTSKERPSTPSLNTSNTTLTDTNGTVSNNDLKTTSKIVTNPGSVDHYSYLGCFGSSNEWQPFSKMGESKDMSLEKCINMCDGIKYAGIFDTDCFCADELDPNTRATGSDDMCDMACPGNNDQYCGGWAKNKVSQDSWLGAKANVTSPSNSSTSASAPGSSSSGLMRATLNETLSTNSTGTVNKARTIAARSMLWSNIRRGNRREAASRLLTLYAAVSGEEPEPAPAMGAALVKAEDPEPAPVANSGLLNSGLNSGLSSGLNSGLVKDPEPPANVVTSITYKTVYPVKPAEVNPAPAEVNAVKPAEVTNAKFITTVVTEACGCTNSTVMSQPTAEPTPTPSTSQFVGDAPSLKIGSTIAFAVLVMAAVL